VLVNVDAKALEVLCAAYLSNDPILCNEIITGVDMHQNNQNDFKLPTRLIAKTLTFRILYGGTEYSFAQDPDFTEVSTSKKYWKEVIEKFYDKYKGLSSWHSKLIQTASSTNKIVMPTGRFYTYESYLRNGDIVWPRTTILNYPVQGLGADLMSIIRVSFHKRFKAARFVGQEISTIHDSIVVDVPKEEVEAVCRMFESVFNDLPMNFERVFGVPFNLPSRCEVSYGNDKYSLQTWDGNGIIIV
jgi:DNA polymerase-1